MTGPGGHKPLSVEDLRALDVVTAATADELRAAVRRLPTHQRAAMHWLARELGLKARGKAPEELEAEARHARLCETAAAERERFDQAISSSRATPAEKAFLAQHLAHLWATVEDGLRKGS